LEFLNEYGLFLAKTVTLCLALLFVVIVVVANAQRQRPEAKPKGHITVLKLNDELENMREDIRHEILDQDLLKLEEKEEKKKDKADKKARLKALKEKSKLAQNIGETDQEAENDDEPKRVFVMSFDGDSAASAVEELRQVITAVLQVARTGKDSVMLRLESPGGLVHAYGLASSQLARLRKHNIHLTVCVDRVAASGGYMMACVANELIAAPFAYIGSIGVLVQLPNVHRLLKHNKVDFEMITAGEYKRTLTTFGENTDADRAKVQEEVDEMHLLFKNFIHEYRPALDVTQVATGEVWTGSQALAKGLIDQIDTSDEWIVARCADADVYEISWEQKRRMSDKLAAMLEGSMQRAFSRTLTQWLHRADKEKFFS
jgi:serine protease SohB